MSSHFTTKALADLKLPGYPSTSQGWDKRVKMQGWEFIETQGRGRGGKRREYVPPPEIMALIESKDGVAVVQLLETAISATAKAKGRKAPVRVSGRPSAEWIILTAMIVSDADWLPDHLKQNIEDRGKLALSLFDFLSLYLGSSDARWDWMWKHKDVLQLALRFIYEMEQMYADLEKDASVRENNSKPTDKP